MKKGDFVTLNEKGKQMLADGRFPLIIKALYTTILRDTAEIILVEDEYAIVKIHPLRYPATTAANNNFGVLLEYIQLVDDQIEEIAESGGKS
jgi:hypothetical protein